MRALDHAVGTYQYWCLSFTTLTLGLYCRNSLPSRGAPSTRTFVLRRDSGPIQIPPRIESSPSRCLSPPEAADCILDEHLAHETRGAYVSPFTNRSVPCKHHTIELQRPRPVPLARSQARCKVRHTSRDHLRELLRLPCSRPHRANFIL